VPTVAVLTMCLLSCGGGSALNSDAEADAGTGSGDARVPDVRGAVCRVETLGKPCEAADGKQEDRQCGEGGLCLLDADTNRGVCTCLCAQDDPGTVRNEDTCPKIDQHICAPVRISTTLSVGMCFERCVPRLGANDCQSPIVCDPRAAELIGVGQGACMVEGCKSNEDCEVTTGIECDTRKTGECASGTRCVADFPGESKGQCVRDGRCDVPSGLCGPRTDAATFKPDAKVGDPCHGDIDCGAAMRCVQQLDLGDVLKKPGEACVGDSECCNDSCEDDKCSAAQCRVSARNGYCTVLGCAFESLTEFACPQGSGCLRVGGGVLPPGGACMRTCDPADAGQCRGNANDVYGDYECRAWDQLQLLGASVADTPICDFVENARCDQLRGLTDGCESLGIDAQTTEMKCRGLDGKETEDPFDAQGYCLDTTGSGDL